MSFESAAEVVAATDATAAAGAESEEEDAEDDDEAEQADDEGATGDKQGAESAEGRGVSEFFDSERRGREVRSNTGESSLLSFPTFVSDSLTLCKKSDTGAVLLCS